MYGGDGRCDVKYDDGDEDRDVLPEDIRPLGGGGSGGDLNDRESIKMKGGDIIEANYRGRGKFYPGP